MKNNRIPKDCGSKFDNPLILKVKKIKNVMNLNNERTFSDCCCEGHCGSDCTDCVMVVGPCSVDICLSDFTCICVKQ
jgi:hypothetical protein